MVALPERATRAPVAQRQELGLVSVGPGTRDLLADVEGLVLQRLALLEEVEVDGHVLVVVGAAVVLPGNDGPVLGGLGEGARHADANPCLQCLGHNVLLQCHVEDVVGGLQHDEAGAHEVEIIQGFQKAGVAAEGEFLGKGHLRLKVVCQQASQRQLVSARFRGAGRDSAYSAS